MSSDRPQSTADGRIAIVVHAKQIRVLVVGAGKVGERKALGFAGAGASVRVIAPRAEAGLRDAAAAGALDLTLRGYQPTDIADAELVIAATDDHATNADIAADARAAHRLCNVVDSPEEGNFSSIAQRVSGALLIAIGADGVPSAATRILTSVCERLDARYGNALTALGALRGRLLARGSRADWERASTQLIGDDFIARVEDGSTVRDAAGWE